MKRNAEHISPAVSGDLAKGLEQPLSEVDITKLATTDVPVDGADVRILGVWHGSSPHIKLYSSHVDQVREHIAKTAAKGRSWLSEQRLASTFGIYSTAELSDIDEYTHAKLDNAGVFFRYSDREMAQRSSTTEYNSDLPEYAREQDEVVKDFSISPGREETIRRVGRLQKLTEMAELPQPLDMEASIILADDDWENRVNVSVDRSGYMARDIRKKIAGGVKKVGLFCGEGHRSAVAYLLGHPEYDPRESLRKATQRLGLD